MKMKFIIPLAMATFATTAYAGTGDIGSSGNPAAIRAALDKQCVQLNAQLNMINDHAQQAEAGFNNQWRITYDKMSKEISNVPGTKEFVQKYYSEISQNRQKEVRNFLVAADDQIIDDLAEVYAQYYEQISSGKKSPMFCAPETELKEVFAKYHGEQIYKQHRYQLNKSLSPVDPVIDDGTTCLRAVWKTHEELTERSQAEVKKSLMEKVARFSMNEAKKYGSQSEDISILVTNIIDNPSSCQAKNTCKDSAQTLNAYKKIVNKYSDARKKVNFYSYTRDSLVMDGYNIASDRQVLEGDWIKVNKETAPTGPCFEPIKSTSDVVNPH